ncbi:hypothetical protein [Lentisalinibacter orientalis]|uniref:hypothetical protein n=1 Tax=Lentisalinibacter orientalis TaxID=2992241 RepID=UPI00386B9AAF
MADETLSREVRGGRKAFFEDPAADRLLAMLTAFLGEHWVLRERVAALEALLVEQGVVDREALENWEPSGEAAAAAAEERAALLRRVLDAGRNVDR